MITACGLPGQTGTTAELTLLVGEAQHAAPGSSTTATLIAVEGGPIRLDKPVNGAVAAYEDGFTVLEFTRKYRREAGLDVPELDELVR